VGDAGKHPNYVSFSQLMRILSISKDLRNKIEEIEKKYDKQFAIVFKLVNNY